MKRWVCILLSLLLCLSLLGCGQKQPAEGVTDTVTDPPVETPPVEEVPPAEMPPAQTPVPPPEEPAPAEPLPDVIESHYSAGFPDYDSNININNVLEVKGVLPYCEDLPTINAYYQALWDDLHATYQLTHTDALAQKADLTASGQEFLPWAVEVSSEVLRNDGTTLSVLREIYENFGGAHPMITYQAETFDVASQGRLLLSDLFSVAEDTYAARLQDMILAQMDQKETESGVLYYDFAREQLMTLLDPMDFALTGDSLLLFYNAYALAPHAAGPQHFYLPLSDLSDIVKPQYLAE